jgi:CubicO group peptidase (beta-lactamase class C family)
MKRRTLLTGALAQLTAPNAFAGDKLPAAAAYSSARRGVALVVLQHGRLIFEDYPNRGGPERGWELASGTKSFTGVIAAAAVKDGLLALDEPAAATLPKWRGDGRRSRITLRQLLSLNSGLDVGRPLRAPTYAATVASPAVADPGARFTYGPAPFQVFGEIMRRKLAARKLDRDAAAYLQRRVLDPIGAAPTRWRQGGDGMPLMPQGAIFRARRWAAFGRWVMEGGGDLVDRAALADCFRPSATNPGYGMSWWLLRPGLIPPGRMQPMDIAPDGAAPPEDVRMAAGAGDQRLYLVPKRGLVIARQASFRLRDLAGRLDPDKSWSDVAFLRLLLDELSAR